ncbi:ArnT family glycosyltransferase [Nocardia stercoris]|uniref:Glycosyl transferase n=1 Tax=Nocardia stercoris TaxID=2483361 RepID=A0A3M2L9U2_9NOCA|nr:glycosyltransferase family 39 protein [Nocardia stercoris]RMI34337.1 glycosyl transferase [Nocardia stercoris]
MTTVLSEAVPPTATTAETVRRRPISRELIALAVLLIATAGAYLWNLNASGWANSFYAAAAQAGSVSWKAFFFGSSDAANSITVDKTPAALWPMALSIRLFGLSSWSVLVPQVLIGVGSVALLWATVRRTYGAAAGLLAGLVLAVTPVAALMFRFDNPDALLVLLMLAACWAMTRALTASPAAQLRWLALCGLFVGFGFLAKQLQVLLVVPALALTYLVAGRARPLRRVAQLFAAAAGLVVGAGWWIAVAMLWPVGSRPYFGGSQHNSILELTMGYNGLGRLNGQETGSVGGGGGGGALKAGQTGAWGDPGIDRLFQPAQGGQIAWLLPAALILLVVGLIAYGQAPRVDPRRAGLVLWGGWLVVTGLTFSFMKGIFHQYYTVALAPAVAALTGIGATLLWQHRDRLWARIAAAVTLAATAATAWMLLSRTSDFVPWLRWVVLVAGILATVALLMPLPRPLATVTAATAVAVALAGPVAYTADTLNTGHGGAIPSAGPMVPGGFGFPRGGKLPPGMAEWAEQMGFGPGGPGAPGQHGNRPGAPGAPGNQHDGKRGPGGFGGPFGGGTPSDQVVALLDRDGASYTWVAATTGSDNAAGYQLATRLPVMPIGGFNGSDPSPTLEQFQQYVAAGKIHYYVVSGGMFGTPGGLELPPGMPEGFGRGGDPNSPSAQISTWVKEHFCEQTVDGVTLYDLTQPK